ncbi:MAG: GH92 family glycosyl hydrolase [Calditrichaeota bacterium]|nr:GH92 family glycosyl hydrolase [Calditrichota bacterium]
MRRILYPLSLIILVSSGFLFAQNNIDFVDPKIGNLSQLLVPTRPTVQQPNQIVRMHPVRRDYLDEQIDYFPLNIFSHRQGENFAIMPLNSENDIKNNPDGFAYDADLEIIKPYHYNNWLEDLDITVEFVPGKKTGFFRFNFSTKNTHLVHLYNLNSGELIPDKNTIHGFENKNGIKTYIYGVIDKETTLKNLPAENNKSNLLLICDPRNNPTVSFKYGLSYLSIDQAKRNLEKEIPEWDFEKLKDTARESWEDVLNRVEVEGGTESQKRTFYTALWRSHERMVDISEDGQYYSGYDHQIHEENRPFYVDDWAWDTYLAHHPLRAILFPDKEADILQSYVRMYQQSGWMPGFPLMDGDGAIMNGFHINISFLDAWRKGIQNFDIKTAYEGARKNALEATMLPWRNGPKCELDDFYHENGYYPALKPGEKETVERVHSFEKRQAVAVTLGHSYDDWALAELAGELNKKDDQDLFRKKALNYKNLYWAEKGFFMPKDSDGNWIDVDPGFSGGMGGREYYDENDGWTYLWQVQHDIDGMIDLFGGKEKFVEKLDRTFRTGLDRSRYAYWAQFPDASGLVGRFSMGNEPSFHIPYLYNFGGAPWKTQKRTRLLLDVWFKDTVFGIPGDEDGGGMSAFVVFTSMGFYPVTPGKPVYSITSPVFKKVTIHLQNGNDFTIDTINYDPVNKYIQKAWFNGQPLNEPVFSHKELMNGGTLLLEMGLYPNKKWGTGL